IFYDPLLTKIQKKEKQGYNLEIRWPKSLNKVETQSQNMHILVIVYADDTIFIIFSKEKLEKIIKIAQDFYKINDIKINSKKSELLIVGGKKTKELRYIEMGAIYNKVTERKANE
ncbi:11044_t:CDS:1, partial [Dentiscutata heterogama]